MIHGGGGSSSAIVALSCDDILEEILLRLPPESISKFIMVSKRWLRLIRSSSFRYSYVSRWRANFRLLGFFVCSYMYLGRFRRPKSELALPLLSTCKEGNDLKCSGILNQLGYFIDSSNGLLLCGRHPKTYYVWNPFTKQRHELPQPRELYRDLCIAFIAEYCCDDLNNICYKVIRAKCESGLDDLNIVSIETFSSNTNTWKQSMLTCATSLALCPWKTATVISGVIYWHAIRSNLAIYDTHCGEERVALIKLPDGDLTYDYNASVFGVSSDGLLQFGQSGKLSIEIWVLQLEEGDYTSIYSSNGHLNYQWNLRYKLSYQIMLKKNPTFMRTISRQSTEYELLAFLPQNSESVFIRSGSRIFLLYLESEKLEVISYHGHISSIQWEFSNFIPYFKPAWSQSSLCSMT